MQSQATSKKWLNTEQAARKIGRKPSTLERWRRLRIGPSYYRVMKQVRYTEDGIEEFQLQGKVDIEPGAA